jgi:hypothetical protein
VVKFAAATSQGEGCVEHVVSGVKAATFVFPAAATALPMELWR